ncbi:MAG: drug/metabolite exporter YedA [Nitrospiraceae bacterium]|nr:drug/metabolite exporter YedA [Nitrospiraceae bacterium]
MGLNEGAEGRGKVIAALLCVYLFWGSTYLAIRIGLEAFPPFLMAGVRYTVAGLMIFLFLRMRGQPGPSLVEWRNGTLIGGFLLLVGNGGVVYAEQTVASGLAALMIATTPLFMVMFAGIWGRWPSRREWAGLLLGLSGVVLLSVRGTLSADPAGACVLLLAAASWAFGSVWSGYLTMPEGLMMSAVEMICGGGLLLITGALAGERIPAVVSWRSVAALGWLVVFGSIVGFSAYLYLLGKVRPALASSYAYVNPVIAMLLGMLLAGEAIGGTEVLSMFVIIAGVGIVISARKA